MKIALLGDIAPFGRYCFAEHPDILAQFTVVRDYLAQFDLVIGNLESPFALSERPVSGKSATIKAHPANVHLLTTLGVTHVTLANNHIGDYGRVGYERTKRSLDDAGISWFGTESKQVYIEKAGEKIALLGYCSYNTNPSTVNIEGSDGLNYLDAQAVHDAVKRNASNGFLNILAVHSGQEHIHMPSSDDVRFARGLADVVNYVYYGHHPHVVQGHEQIFGSAVFYSLGNFVFDDVYTPRDLKKPLITLSEANKTGGIGTVEILDGQIIDAGVTPIYMGEDQMLIGDSVPDFDMAVYNAYLANVGTPEYEQKRASEIRTYIDSRRELRDLNWYIRRLNLNSVGIILNARKNARLYRKLFTSQLPLRGNNL
jgi:poly-gamma-glutamate synthesis protein (capsule biosynthesis protein)